VGDTDRGSNVLEGRLPGATPTAQRANANQAEATDLASVIILASEL
jgi:hypothetical protein